MKKLLVILMLGAGFVTVASASVDCNISPSSSPCCDDLAEMSQSFPDGGVKTNDGYTINSLNPQLIADGAPLCLTNGNYSIQDIHVGIGTFGWERGDWQGTIHCENSVNNKCRISH